MKIIRLNTLPQFFLATLLRSDRDNGSVTGNSLLRAVTEGRIERRKSRGTDPHRICSCHGLIDDG